MNELHLFAGGGGGILGGQLLGNTCVCAVEIQPYCQEVLLQRQRDGVLPRFPIWDDVTTFNGKPWRGIVDVVCGGFPCQDISSAGTGAGIEGERSGLWKQMARIIGEVLPEYVFVENSPLLVGRGLAMVLGDLDQMGYDVRWGVLGADDVGAPHRRKRIWILAHSRHLRGRGRTESDFTAESETPNGREIFDSLFQRLEGSDNNGEFSERIQSEPCKRRDQIPNAAGERSPGPGESWFRGDPAEIGEGETDHAFSKRLRRIWGIESPLGRVAHGVANRMDRLKAIGNGQVPAVARLAWETLKS